MLHSSVHPVRHALLAALGLAALACGPNKATSADDDGSAEADASASGDTGNTGGNTGTVTDGPPAACAGVVTAIDQAYSEPPVASGFERCDGGIAHRVAAIACAVPAAPTDCVDNTGGGTCTANADCTDMPHGSCRQDISFGGVLVGGTCSCRYGCAQDSDCADGEICRCAGEGLGPTSECIPAECTVDADCGDGLCGVYIGTCSDGAHETHCTTPNDSCKSDADCDGQPCVWIDYNDPKSWACNDAVCGRPYLVDAAAALAPAAARDDWREPLLPALPPARARLAAAWTELARMEHASVAAFASFTLQLLAAGAPPELLRDTNAALGDELLHARLAFGLASAYAGSPVGPGPLPLATTVPADLTAMLVALVREACVCETLSALEAREAAAIASDPVVQQVWARIAADEQRHAELGWRTLQWILRVDPSLRALARDTFTAAVAEAQRGADLDALHPADQGLRRHGLIDPSLRAAIWRRGLAELIDPCADARCAAA